jgi:hypothetical protein
MSTSMLLDQTNAAPRPTDDELPRPVHLSDEAMSAILAASYPLPPDRRSDFLVDVARELARLPQVGDGVAHRVVTMVQKKYFDPPIEDHRGAHAGSGKYSR